MFFLRAKTKVNMTSRLLLLASRNLGEGKERKKRLEIAGFWLYRSRLQRLVDRLSKSDLRRRKTVSLCELPVEGLGRLTKLSLALLWNHWQPAAQNASAWLRSVGWPAACNSDTRYIASIGTPTNDPEGLSDAIPFIPLFPKRTSCESLVAAADLSCRLLHSATPPRSRAESSSVA